MADVLVAKDSFWFTDSDGSPKLVHKGDRFREGHPTIKGRESLFEEDKSVQEFETPKRSPGRPSKS